MCCSQQCRTHWLSGGEEGDGLAHEGLSSSGTLSSGLGDHVGGAGDAVNIHANRVNGRLQGVLQAQTRATIAVQYVASTLGHCLL
jgi:hypothetical protein